MDALIRHDLEVLLEEHRALPHWPSGREKLTRDLETFIEERFVKPAIERAFQRQIQDTIERLERAGAHDGAAKQIAEETMRRLADQAGFRTPSADRAPPGKPKRARKAKRWAGRAGVLALVLLAACGSTADDVVADDALDADAGADDDGRIDLDAGPDAADPDAGPGLALGSDCDPTVNECAGGLSCRVVGFNPTLGRCELAGPLGVGEHCNLNNGDGDCGAAMACLGDPPVAACYLICDRADPAPRCGAGGTCVPVWGAAIEIGACAP